MSSPESQEAYSLFTGYVIQRTKKLEQSLEQNYGAVGRGLGEKVSNVEHKLDSEIVRQLRFIVAIRNKMTHEVNYVYDGNPNDFLRKCDEMLRRLSKPPEQKQTHTARGQTYTPPPPKVNPPPRYSNTTSRAYSYARPSPSTSASPNSSRSKVREVRRPLLTPSRVRGIFKAALIVTGLVVAFYFGNQILSAIKYQFNGSSASTETPVSRPQPQKTVKVEKVLGGRTPNEKMYQFTVPAKTWVETSMKIKPNQEVLIHHFRSDERITVNLAEFTDSRLQTPGTVMPLYTSTNCSADRGVQANIQYTCVQLNQPESVKLYAENSAPVGIYIRNR